MRAIHYLQLRQSAQDIRNTFASRNRYQFPVQPVLHPAGFHYPFLQMRADADYVTNPSQVIYTAFGSDETRPPNASTDRTSTSIDTEGSPASILATLDWLD